MVFLVCNRYENPLGSTWQRQTKTIVWKTSTAAIKWRDKQTSAIPFLLCYLITFHYICSVHMSVLILDYATISKASAFFLMPSHMAPNFQKAALTKLFLARASQLSWLSEELKQVWDRFSFLHVARHCQRSVSCLKSQKTSFFPFFNIILDLILVTQK